MTLRPSLGLGCRSIWSFGTLLPRCVIDDGFWSSGVVVVVIVVIAVVLVVVVVAVVVVVVVVIVSAL